jgi:hypothetical protein
MKYPAMLSVIMDLGRPEKFWRLFMFFYLNNMTSMFAINAIFYSSYVGLLVFYLGSALANNVKLTRRVAPIAIACAVLVPTEKAGRRIAGDLQKEKIEAHFMTGKDLDLTAKCVKVLTLKSSKGLEFPVVALAGFFGMPWPIRANWTGLFFCFSTRSPAFRHSSPDPYLTRFSTKMQEWGPYSLREQP